MRRVDIRGFQEECSSVRLRTCQLEGRLHLRDMSPMNPRFKARHYPIPRGPWCPIISPEAAAGIRILLQILFCSSRHIHPGYQRTEPRCHDSARSAGSSTKDGNRQYLRAQRRFKLSWNILVCYVMLCYVMLCYVILVCTGYPLPPQRGCWRGFNG